MLLSSGSMFLLTEPEGKKIEALLQSQAGKPFSYVEVGASRGSSPSGYNVDHNRVLLGHGRETFSKTISAVNDWKMFDLGWVGLNPPRPAVKPGEVVAVLVRHLGFWSINISRIVYTIQETERYGFAYGTLPCHAERGEESFMVEYDSQTDEVWYDLYAFSKPGHLLARLGYPFSRQLQKRFARESLKAMKDAVRK